jgi:hypothetical protein
MEFPRQRFQRLEDKFNLVVGKEQPKAEALPALLFLYAVVLETLRLHGAIPLTFPHVNTVATTLS